MKNRFKHLLGKKGLTLVEILVVLVVSSILLGIAMGMLMPVSRLMNSLKGNAHMDAMCDTANEYIRGTLQTATSVSVFSFPDLPDDEIDWSAMEDQLTEYKKDTAGYQIKLLAVLRNYNDDYRIYDFGDVTDLNDARFHWAASFHPDTLQLLIKNRDGGGRWQGGLDGNEFHRFDAFNEAFYSNGFESGELNYSYQVCFDSVGKELKDEEGNVTPGIGYLNVKSQIFKRTEKAWVSKEDGSYEHHIPASEPVNQLRSLSFNIFNGDATLDSEQKVNSTVVQDGAEMIDTSSGMSGVVILYKVRDIDSIIGAL